MTSLRAAAVLVSLAVAGCSLLLETAEPVQCTTDADCDASPLLRNLTCSKGICVVATPERGPVNPVDAGEGCVSTELCTQKNSNQPSVCKTRGGACTPWHTTQCPYFSGAWSAPNPIVIGDIQPFTVRQFNGSRKGLPYADRVRLAANLALGEFAADSPGGWMFPNGERRPLAIVHCDSGLYPEGARAAMKHLTEVVGVQAMIVGADEDLASITPELTDAKTAVACSDCLGPLPSGPLAWRIVPRLELEAPMAAWRVARIEQTVAATPAVNFKVAVLMTPGRATDAFVSAFTNSVRFNGKSADGNGSDFAIVRTEIAPSTQVDFVKHAETLVAFQPDVIVVAMTDDFPTYFLPLIEEKWTSAKHRPYYVTTDLNFKLEAFASAITSDDLRTRISGTRPGFSQALEDNVDAFRKRYQQANNSKQPDGSQSGYDAFYALALAILANRGQSLLDGPHISAGFERLRGGSIPTDFRPEKIAFASAILGQQTGNLDARGLWSDLEWNIATRDMESNVSMYCFGRDNAGKLVLRTNAGPLLDTSTGLVSNVYSCD